MDHDLIGVYITLSAFGGTALVIWTSVQAKISVMRARARLHQEALHPEAETPSKSASKAGSRSASKSLPQESVLLAEFQALRREVAEMHSTAHEFDLSFDEALNRMESRVARLETKSSAGVAASVPAEVTLGNGNSSTPQSFPTVQAKGIVTHQITHQIARRVE